MTLAEQTVLDVRKSPDTLPDSDREIFGYIEFFSRSIGVGIDNIKLSTFIAPNGQELIKDRPEINKIIMGIKDSLPEPTHVTESKTLLEDNKETILKITSFDCIQELQKQKTDLEMHRSRVEDAVRLLEGKKKAFVNCLIKVENLNRIIKFGERDTTVYDNIKKIADDPRFQFYSFDKDLGKITFLTTECVRIKKVNAAAGLNIDQNFGMFRIIIDLLENSIKVKPALSNIFIKSYIHPNISADGSICWGDGKYTALELLANKSYFELLNMLHYLLNNDSDKTPYVPLASFSKEENFFKFERTNSPHIDLKLVKFIPHDLPSEIVREPEYDIKTPIELGKFYRVKSVRESGEAEAHVGRIGIAYRDTERHTIDQIYDKEKKYYRLRWLSKPHTTADGVNTYKIETSSTPKFTRDELEPITDTDPFMLWYKPRREMLRKICGMAPGDRVFVASKKSGASDSLIGTEGIVVNSGGYENRLECVDISSTDALLTAHPDTKIVVAINRSIDEFALHQSMYTFSICGLIPVDPSLGGLHCDAYNIRGSSLLKRRLQLKELMSDKEERKKLINCPECEHNGKTMLHSKTNKDFMCYSCGFYFNK